MRHPVSQRIGEGDSNDPIKLSVYARIAQSAFLLSHVIDRVSAWDPNSSSCGAAILDHNLRSFAMALLEPSDRKLHCWPYTMCLRLVSI
jgi:hypothetical protein